MRLVFKMLHMSWNSVCRELCALQSPLRHLVQRLPSMTTSDKTVCDTALTLLPALVSASLLNVWLFYLLARKPVLSHTLSRT